MLDHILELNKNGTTIVLTTHYLEEAQKICKQIGILNHGEMVEYGKTNSLLEKISTKNMTIHPEKNIPSKLQFPPSVVYSLRADGALQLSFDKSVISAEEVLDICRENKIAISDIATSEPALEDVFKLATKPPGDHNKV